MLKFGESYEQTQQITEIAKFNVNFTKFEDRKDITAQEIATLFNFVKEYNKNNDPDITIIPNIGNNPTDVADFVSVNTYKNGKRKYYECENIEYNNDNEGRVGLIKFTEKK